MKERIDRIEVKLERHSLHLSKIQSTIDQVRYMGAGMILLYLLSNLGIAESFKFLIN